MIYGVAGKEIIEVPKGLFPTADAVAEMIIRVADLGEDSVLFRIKDHIPDEPPPVGWNLVIVRAEVVQGRNVAVDSYLTVRSPDAEIVEEPVGSGRFQVALHERYNGSTAERVRVALTSST